MKNSMKKAISLFLVTAAFAGADASWYWPFGDEEKDEKEKPRLSVLMEPASLLIDDASDLAMDGKVTEAIAKYREALAALDKVEAEHPDRVQSPEFATLRNKRAYVNAAIDSMLMSQVKDNAKAVAVSDTTELEKRLAEERAAKDGEKSASKTEKPRVPAAETRKTGNAASVEAQPESVKPVRAGKAATRNERIISDIAAGEFEAAAIMIGEMLEEKPNGAAALNLKAAMETAQGKYKEAERTLDQAIMSNPRSHYAYYNMARLILQSRPDGRMAARRYYETGRAVGGPVDSELEGLVK